MAEPRPAYSWRSDAWRGDTWHGDTWRGDTSGESWSRRFDALFHR